VRAEPQRASARAERTHLEPAAAEAAALLGREGALATKRSSTGNQRVLVIGSKVLLAVLTCAGLFFGVALRGEGALFRYPGLPAHED
jgi:hypothetical protein